MPENENTAPPTVPLNPLDPDSDYQAGIEPAPMPEAAYCGACQLPIQKLVSVSGSSPEAQVEVTEWRHMEDPADGHEPEPPQ